MSTRFARAWGALASTMLAAAVIGHGAPASAQTSFTYQGRLKSAGAPYNGAADLRFTLHTAASGGSVVGAAQSALNISVTDGLVTTALDFGALAFDGAPRWLQIEVKTPSTGGAGPYTPLTPRQPVNPAPYAMYALNASISGPQPNAVSFTNAANAFTGSGAGLISLNASAISTGTLNVARLPTGGSWSLASKLSVDGGTLTVDQGNNLVGINNEFPQSRTLRPGR